MHANRNSTLIAWINTTMQKLHAKSFLRFISNFTTNKALVLCFKTNQKSYFRLFATLEVSFDMMGHKCDMIKGNESDVANGDFEL